MMRDIYNTQFWSNLNNLYYKNDKSQILYKTNTENSDGPRFAFCSSKCLNPELPEAKV